MRLLKSMVIIVFFFSTVGWIWQSPTVKKSKEAAKLYNEGKLDEALSKWRDAQIESPDKKELHYNIGGALHEQKRYDDSFKEYEKALDTKDDELKPKTYYNIGNTHYRMGKLPEAIEDYEKCLQITPDDEDAKYNIEFIKKKMEEQKQEQQQESQQQEQEGQGTRDKGQGKKQQQQQQGQEEQKEGQGEEQQDQEGQETPNQSLRSGTGQARDKGQEEGEEKKEEEDARTENREPRTEKEMSEEDAIRLLDAIKDDEQDLQKELRVQPIEGRYKVDKDW
ncbi:MAG: tetratricopeptide repeat protein [Candidatus Omnitrophica bacterium]|nr:tetratricopeptide repeat protein [Candidatus Omnitrophota bacterium]